MTLHIMREVRAHAQGRQLTREQRARIERALADKRTRRGAQARVTAGLKLEPLPGFTADLHGELSKSTLDHEYSANMTDAAEGMAQLRGMFEHHGRVPVLIMEDTDAWLRGSGRDDSETVEAFFSRNVARIAREFEITLIVAAHDTYLGTAGYQRAREVMAGEIIIPSLRRPQEALRSILQRRIERADVNAGVSDVFEDAAIIRLEAEYDHGRSIRRVLRLAHDALDASGPGFPARLTDGHIRSAAIGDYRP